MAKISVLYAVDKTNQPQAARQLSPSRPVVYEPGINPDMSYTSCTSD